MINYYKKILLPLIFTISFSCISCFAQEQILQIAVGIDTWLHISVENGFLKFNGDKNGVSSHSDLKHWQGFFYTKPTAKISAAGKSLQRWNMQKKFPLKKIFSNSSKLTIKSVTLTASGRTDCSIHTDPANVNQIPQSDIKKTILLFGIKTILKYMITIMVHLHTS